MTSKKMAIIILSVIFAVALVVPNVMAYDWKKCKGAYDKARVDCNKKFGADPNELEECYNDVYKKLYECRIKKGRFKDGKTKEELEREITRINNAHDKCLVGCLQKPGGDCSEKCNKDADKAVLAAMKKYVSISGKDDIDVDYRQDEAGNFLGTAYAMITKYRDEDADQLEKCNKIGDDKKKKDCHKKAAKASDKNRKKALKQAEKDYKQKMKEMQAQLKTIEKEKGKDSNEYEYVQTLIDDEDLGAKGLYKSFLIDMKNWPEYKDLK